MPDKNSTNGAVSGRSVSSCSSARFKLRRAGCSFRDIDEFRQSVIEECAVAIESQIKGSRYQWESDSHFGSMTKEMANRLRSLKTNACQQAPPETKKNV